MPADEYLGDGVYASFDGYQVWLHVGAHTSPAVVALEPDVILRLNEYWSRKKSEAAASEQQP